MSCLVGMLFLVLIWVFIIKLKFFPLESPMLIPAWSSLGDGCWANNGEQSIGPLFFDVAAAPLGSRRSGLNKCFIAKTALGQMAILLLARITFL